MGVSQPSVLEEFPGGLEAYFKTSFQNSCGLLGISEQNRLHKMYSLNTTLLWETVAHCDYY